jgi:alpha,alpha-trehalose phosphorylase
VAPSIELGDIDAVLFDLDGVLTTTRAVHAAAWKQSFDEFLAEWDTEHGTRTARFDDSADYANYVDGKPRQDGVRDFLASRGIELPEGEPDSPPEEVSVWGLGNRKQLVVEERLAQGVEVFPGSVAWVRELRDAGIKTAVVSSSRNCEAVLKYAGISDLFDTRVDGETTLELHLPGKPAPDAFLEGARRRGPTRVNPGRPTKCRYNGCRSAGLHLFTGLRAQFGVPASGSRGSIRNHCELLGISGLTGALRPHRTGYGTSQ